MRLIHGLHQINGLIFVTLLVVTQILSPLIHGHGGYKEPIRGLHVPGFENLSRSDGQIAIDTAKGFQNAGHLLIVTVASGIEPRHLDDPGLGSLASAALPSPASRCHVIFSRPDSKALSPDRLNRPGWNRQPSRGPPFSPFKRSATA